MLETPRRAAADARNCANAVPGESMPLKAVEYDDTSIRFNNRCIA